ncbi:MAG: tripartite tricarboxylate transporter TctB family protein [Pseudomonadota bacterium]
MKNIIAALVIIGGSLFFYFLAGRFPEVTGFQQMGDAFWPRLILLVLMGLSAILLIQTLLSRSQKKSEKKLPAEPRSRLAMLQTMAGIILYVLAIPYLGFLLSTFCALMAFSYLMGNRKMKNTIFFSLGMTAAIYVVFGFLIYTSLPRGVWIFKSLSNLLY